MLLTEKNTTTVDRRIRRDFASGDLGRVHRKIETTFEHGQWWVSCRNCSCQFSVCDTNGPFDFEQVSGGDPLLCPDED